MATRTLAGKPRTPTPRRPPADPVADMVLGAGLGEPARAALVQALAHQLVEDHYAKLDQAGHAEDEGIPLRRVFVDLHTTTGAGDEGAEATSKKGVVAGLLAMKPVLFGDAPAGPGRRGPVAARMGRGPVAARMGRGPVAAQMGRGPVAQPFQRSQASACAGLVLIGGPGQGKSTLGQLACQAHRAALLVVHEPILTMHERSVLKDFTDPEAVKELGAPAHPSLPLRIVLPDAAAWLAEQHQSDPFGSLETPELPWLLRFWHARLPESVRSALPPAALLALLRAGPFLLVLDGLDEVPAAWARQRVLSAVRDLGAALGGTRGLVVATTRPQGYAGELDGLGIPLQTHYLAPLTPERALEYAARLVKARISDGNDRRNVLERMREASREPSTQRLMTTPLQVTILAALLRRGGRPPRERWSLFARYYDVMYQRELAKPTDTAELLHTYKDAVYKIHARAGLLLQVESEVAERAGALLTRDRLGAIVQAVLSEEGFTSAQRPELIERIVTAAAHRLVFLVQPQEDRFGFEIRSLQELMAAAALAQKNETATKARLIHVAKAGSFRNVTLFLTGKLLAESGDLRDAVAREVCPALEQDPRDPLASVGRAGAILALEVLEDGAALGQPRRAEDLMRVALGILDLAPCALQVRLARLLLGEETPAHAVLEPLVRDGIQARLGGESKIARVGAWVALLPLVEFHVAWAVPLAQQTWPRDDAEAQRAIVEAVLDVAGESGSKMVVGPWLLERVGASLEHFHWSMIKRLAEAQTHTRGTEAGEPPLQSLLRYLRTDSWIEIPVVYGKERVSDDLAVRRIAPFEELQRVLPQLPTVPAWHAFAAVAAFNARPSAATLAEAIGVVAKHASEKESLRYHSSWPLFVALDAATSVEELRALAERASAGHLGDTPLWMRAEKQWTGGVNIDDVLATFTADPLTWQPEVLPRAPPFLKSYWSIVNGLKQKEQERVATLLTSHLSATSMPLGHWADLLALGLDPDVLKPVLEATPPGKVAALVLGWTSCRSDVLAMLIESGLVMPDTLDQWGRGRPRLVDWTGNLPTGLLVDIHHRNPRLHGLLQVVAQCIEPYDTDPFDDTSAPPSEDISISPELLDRERFSDPLLRMDAWLLRLASGTVRVEDVGMLAQDLHAAVEREPGFLPRILRVASREPVQPAVHDALLVALTSSATHVQTASTVLRAILGRLQARPSGLGEPDTWHALELPLPLPRSAARSAPPPPQIDLTGPPLHLRKLTLHNMRSLEHLVLDLAEPPPDRGQWVVLLGENGAGKSTILRAIVLALRNTSDVTIWPKGAFESSWRRFGSNPETDVCRVSLLLADRIDHETTIQHNGKTIFKQSPERSVAVPAPCLLWAYGCRRGSALGGADREVNVSDVGGPDIATLFDEGASLVHAQTWLQKLDREASRDSKGRAQEIYDAVIGALVGILDVDTIELDGDSNVLLTGKNVGERVPLAALSDGYLTTAGWLIDLLARWIARAKQAGILIGRDFPEKMTGLVLLDEIDLHLHPAWQLDVIPRVRRIFPRLSFVVTTHNPLTIVGARPEEIWILQRTADGVHAEQKPDIPATLTAAQIYARFFGIEDFFPNPLGRQLQRYGFLCGNPYRSDEEEREMETLRGALAEKRVAPGWEELPRAARAPAKSKPRRRKGTAS